MQQEQTSNSTVQATVTVSSQHNETTAFRYSAEEVDVCPPVVSKGLKVLFLSADTGGGHRASAESLANQVSDM